MIFDRRVNTWIVVNAWLFDARFGSTKVVEVQVNPEFTQTQAQTHATDYSTAVGRLPGALFRDLDAIWINGGNQAYGGGNRSILIHVGMTQTYLNLGALDEVLLHEAAHTSLDSYHAATTRWGEAQMADVASISTYARDNPTREDIAETFVVWFAVRFRSSRLTPATVNSITSTVPNRLVYFDCQGLSPSLLP